MRVSSVPEWLQPVNKLVTPLFDKEPDQVIINEYEPGQGISPHVDCVPCFGPVIASLTLQSPTFMQLRYGYDRSNPHFEIQLTPRSLLLLEKSARYDFAHAISKQEHSRRVSVTFRTVILT
jgi:alkylated DNA repair dioxygenase AlkB